jgi:aspartyl-tRNA(Asn)/glutamyl-tRNA(Gln) amidotransferase subunit B
MRSKESAHDYRYFPEPDLLPLLVSDAWIAEVRRALPELPDARRIRFVREYGLPEYDADVLTMRKDVADFYEEAVRHHRNPKALSNWVMGDILRIIKDRKLDNALVIHDWPVAPERLAAMVELIDSGEISGKIAKSVFEEMINTGKTPVQIVDEQGLQQISDEGPIVAAVDAVIAAHPDKVAEYRGGKDKLFGFFVGQAMKATQGKANPQKLNELLRAKLGA